MASTIRGSDNFDSGTIDPTDFGAVGTYLAAGCDGDFAGGETTAGSNLRKNGNTNGQNNFVQNMTVHNSYNQSGTWRAMGLSDDYSGQTWVSSNLWVRIS